MDCPIRFAVVGAGWISQAAFLPALAAAERAQLTALVTGDRAKAAALAEKYGVVNIYDYERYDELLTDGVADAVYLALPNDQHLEFGLKTLRAGLHLLLEKPMALDEVQCRRLIDAAAESGAKLMIAYRLHQDRATLDTIELVRSGAIGELRLFTATFSQAVSPTNHRAHGEHWAGPLPDMGIYPLNAARMLFGDDPVEALAATATGAAGAGFEGVEEAFAVTLRFPGERLAQFTVSYGGASVDEYTIVGSKGSVSMRPGFGFHKPFTRTLTVGEKSTSTEFAATSQFAGEIEYFARCIERDEAPEADGWEGLRDVRVLKAIERAAKERRAVAIEPLPSRHRAKVAVSLPPVREPRNLVHAAEPGKAPSEGQHA